MTRLSHVSHLRARDFDLGRLSGKPRMGYFNLRARQFLTHANEGLSSCGTIGTWQDQMRTAISLDEFSGGIACRRPEGPTVLDDG